jgi:hypothetical protein
MKHHLQLREVAKFFSGLIAGDFITTWWLSAHNYFPIHSLGVTYTTEMVLPALIIDIALFAALVHYGWHLGKIPHVRERTYLLVAGILFTFVAAAHLLRAFFGLPLTLGALALPTWLSWVATIVLAYLAYASFTYAARGRK